MLREIFPGIVHIPIKILAVRYYTVMNGSVPNWFMDSFDIELSCVYSVGATDSNERRVFTIVAAVPAPQLHCCSCIPFRLHIVTFFTVKEEQYKKTSL